MRDISARELKGHNILAVERFWDNPGAKSQGMKQLMAGAGVAVVGMVLVPLLSGLFSV